jgi:hypothetical protein
VRAALVLLALPLALWSASPAAAHPADPTVRTVLDDVAPALPGVTVQVVENIAAQLVVENTTADVLAVLDDDGRPFLRIGPNGVEANLRSPSFWLSNSPSGGSSVPANATPGAEPRWARVASAPTWGWYDHRLHPEARAVPTEVFERQDRATLAEWTVPLEYRGRSVEARGHVEYAPVRGQIVAALVGSTATLPDVSAQLAPGRVPVLLVANDGAEPVVVFGPDNEPFARIGADGAEVNRRSPLWLENARANDQDLTTAGVVADPTAPPEWMVVSSSPSLSWLEPRAAYPDLEPSAAVVASGEREVLNRWAIPLEQGGIRVALEGTTTWLPVEAAAPTGAASSSSDDGTPAWLLVLAIVIPVVLIAGWLGLRTRLRRSG